MSLGTVTWDDDPTKEREVRDFCERCQQSVSQGNFTRRMSGFEDVKIVSPTGLAHAQREDGFEFTACGLNAAGPEWWWKL